MSPRHLLIILALSACTPITDLGEFHAGTDAGHVDAATSDAGRCGDVPAPQGSCSEAAFRCIAECAQDEPCEQACLEGEDACRTCLTTEQLRCASTSGCLTTTEAVLCCYDAECGGDFCDACAAETQEWLLCTERLEGICAPAGLSCFPEGIELCDGVDNDSDEAIDEGASCPPDASCVEGACVVAAECVEPTADCDFDGTCETSVRNNARACGSCDRWCASQVCGGQECIGDQLDVGPAHACTVLFDSLEPLSTRVVCWGEPALFGQAGGSRAAQNVPLPAGLGLPIAVGVGGFGTCVLGTTGATACSLAGLPFELTLTPVPEVRYVDFHLGRLHACFLGDDGSVWCVGDNTYGQRGDAEVEDEFQQAIVSGALEIHGGTDHTCVRAEDGSITCWGRNDGLQLGIRDEADCGTAASGERWCRPGYVPASADTSLLGARAIFGGQDFSCVPTSAATFACWGDAPNDLVGGRMSFGLALEIDTLLDLSASDVISTASGTRFSCALLRDTSIRCYGPADTPAGIERFLGMAQVIAAEGNTLCTYRVTSDLPEITCAGQDLINPVGATAPRTLPDPPVD